MGLGKVIKQLREERGLTQPEFYEGLISKRQAIRFEQDDADVKGIVLLSLLKRLNIEASELDAQLNLPKASLAHDNAEVAKVEQQLLNHRFERSNSRTFYSKNRFSNDKHRVRLAILAILNLPEPLAERDVDFLMDELDVTENLTLAQIELFSSNLDKFPKYEQGEILKRLSKEFKSNEVMQTNPWLQASYFEQAMNFYLLVQGNVSDAKKVMQDYKASLKFLPEDSQIKFQSWQLLLDEAVGKSSAHAEIGKRAQLLLLLGQTAAADRLVDQRRIVQLQFKQEHTWTAGEIGLVARKLNNRPKGSLESAKDFLEHYEGLADAIRTANKPLSFYLNNYEY